MVDIDILKHPGAAAIVAVTDKNEVVLIRQYRHAIGGFIWEIPAGTLDQAEKHLICAGRELEEETGYRAARMRKIGEVVPVPGYSDERIYVYLASGLSIGDARPEHDEYLSIHLFSFEHALEMVYNGEISDAKTIFGLLKTKIIFEREPG